jgi:WD40 repeat protein
VIVTGDAEGTVRVGSVTGQEPHLLLGHEGHVRTVAVSPDSRWIVSATQSEIRLWPMPDLTSVPIHTLPTEEFVRELHAKTNLRVLEDSETNEGWRLEPIPLPVWKEDLR